MLYNFYFKCSGEGKKIKKGKENLVFSKEGVEMHLVTSMTTIVLIEVTV